MYVYVYVSGVWYFNSFVLQYGYYPMHMLLIGATLLITPNIILILQGNTCSDLHGNTPYSKVHDVT